MYILQNFKRYGVLSVCVKLGECVGLLSCFFVLEFPTLHHVLKAATDAWPGDFGYYL